MHRKNRSTVNGHRKNRFQIRDRVVDGVKHGGVIVDTYRNREVFEHGSHGAVKAVAADLHDGRARVRSNGEVVWA